jgi:hypothetical protein
MARGLGMLSMGRGIYNEQRFAKTIDVCSQGTETYGGRVYFSQALGGKLETGHLGPVLTRDPPKRRAGEGNAP